MKQKPSATEKMLQNNGVMKDYDDVIRFYEKYKKEFSPMKSQKLKEELTSKLKPALDTMGKLERVYTTMQKEMQQEFEDKKSESQLYDKKERETFVDEIKRRNIRLKAIEQDLGRKAAPKEKAPIEHLLKQERYPEAIVALMQDLQNQTGDKGSTAYNLIYCYIKLDDKESARVTYKEYKKALNMDDRIAIEKELR